MIQVKANSYQYSADVRFHHAKSLLLWTLSNYKMKKWNNILVAIMCIQLISGCGMFKNDPSLLPGEYSATYKHGKETLNLSSDGTFIQVYSRIEDGLATTNAGTWRFSEEYQTVVFSNIICFNTRRLNGKRNVRSEGTRLITWELVVESTGMNVSLEMGVESSLRFVKSNPVGVTDL